MLEWVRLRFAVLSSYRERKQAANGVERKPDSHRRNVPMRYSRLLATLLVALGATQCLAETPDWSQNSPQAMSILQRTRLLSGPNWYSRYGEPVNAAALEQVDNSPSDKGGVLPAPSVYGDGYIYGPGACDCPPPCIWGLWTGYFQNPWRCHPGNWLHHRHCGAGGDPCGSCGNGCGLFGHNRCNSSCSCTAAVGCSTPTCTTACVTWPGPPA